MSDPVTDAAKPDPAASRYASRKWRFALLLVAAGVGLELAGKLTPLLVDYLKWIFGLYCGFNVTAKAGEWVATYVASKKEPS